MPCTAMAHSTKWKHPIGTGTGFYSYLLTL
jgi:hypothetical protein